MFLQMGSLNRVTSRRYWVVLLKSGRGGQGSRLELYKSEDQRGGAIRTFSLDSVSTSFSPFSLSSLSCPSLSHSLSLSLTHTHTLSLSHTHTLSLPHTHTLSLPHTHTLSLYDTYMYM